MRLFGNRAPALDPLEREAHAWVRRLTSGKATQADAQALQHWRSQSEAHAVAFRHAQEVWHKVGKAGVLVADRRPLPARRVASRAPNPQRRAMLGGAFATAVAAAGVAVVHPPLGLWPSWEDMRADYHTGTGERRDVVLSDNVRVTLNTQTRIALRSDAGTASGIDLVGGEAAFDVARTDRSFMVVAGNGRTLAQNAGVQFEVRNTGGSVCVTCLSGQVRVESAGGSLMLQANQQVVYDDQRMGVAVAVDGASAQAWRNGILVFRQTPLSEVVDEINRYRPGRVILMNDEKARLPLSGRFSVDNLELVLTQIRQAFHVKARTLPGNILLFT
ncbi:signal transduction protein [Bordetella ansorpii]|uniref:Signal transduction protein n=1 Tax=Bordetella ansorpii TaxID=288768 RepID=A0A157SFW7_9BORD|nr:FecR domain-containing protein [Bordetella ansorpii]SAI69121.1 signal transduction protein [Bordetella ansorpii]